MGKAEELLNEIGSSDTTLVGGGMGSAEEHIIIGGDRIISVPRHLRTIAIQYDHNVETITFDCPRYWDGVDMSALYIYINYRRPDGVLGCCAVTNVRTDDNSDVMHFDWTISGNVTYAKGTLKFLVCVKDVDSDGNEIIHWNSELNSEMIISEGLECDGVIIEEDPDIITDLLKRMSVLEFKAVNIIANLEDSEGENSLNMHNTSELTEPADGGDQFPAQKTSDKPKATGTGSFATGIGTNAEGDVATAEGILSKAGYQRTNGTRSIGSHAEGIHTYAKSSGSHAEGYYTEALASNSHAEGFANTVESTGWSGHAEGRENTVSGVAAHAEGHGNVASGADSHVEGNGTTASGNGSHAEGIESVATGTASHSEGYKSVAKGDYSHSEGISVTSGNYSHAEGYHTEAIGNASHSQGHTTKSIGKFSDTSGLSTIATGAFSSVRGTRNIADTSLTSRATGKNVDISGATIYSSEVVYAKDEVVIGEDGKYYLSMKSNNTNKPLTNTSYWVCLDDFRGKYLDIVGNGTSDTNRSNAYTLDWEGNGWFAGDVRVGPNSDELIPMKVGDVKITTRAINDPDWLLCENTKINETNYPELYPIVAFGTDIFKGKWNSAEVVNGGVAPIYSSDGYIYFVKDGSTTASRCKENFTGFETFTMISTGDHIQYENGYWFIFQNNDIGTVYYSSDCFKTDTHTLNEVNNFGNIYPEDPSAANSHVRYMNGFWCFNFYTKLSTYSSYFYYSSTLDGTYTETYLQTPDGDTFGTSSNYKSITDYIVFKNETKLILAYDSFKETTGIRANHQYALYKLKNGEWSLIVNPNSGSIVHTIKRRVSLYIEEIDAVLLLCEDYIAILFKSDGTIFVINLKELIPNLAISNPDTFESVAYFKGYLYLKYGSKIYRYNINDLEAGYETSTKYVTSYDISSSPNRLYMPLDTNNMYYIEDPKELDIPAAFPNSIFKTYIKARQGV